MGVWRFITAVAAGLFLAAPAFAQEREWMLDAADSNVFLVFGVPNTNDIGVSFWCRIGKQDITVFMPVPATETSQKPAIEIDVGGETFKLVGTRPADDNGETVEAKLDDSAKVMSALKSNDRFAITLAKHKTVYPLDGADIDGFLKTCATPPEVSN